MAAIVLQIAFGLTAGGSDDPFVLKMAETMENLSEVTAPGAYLVDSLPFCERSHVPQGPLIQKLTITWPTVKHVPEWFPGAAFKIKGREVREFVARLEQDLYLVTLAQLVGRHRHFYRLNTFFITYSDRNAGKLRLRSSPTS